MGSKKKVKGNLKTFSCKKSSQAHQVTDGSWLVWMSAMSTLATPVHGEVGSQEAGRS